MVILANIDHDSTNIQVCVGKILHFAFLLILQGLCMLFDNTLCCFWLSVCCAKLGPIYAGRGCSSLAGINT